MTDLERAQESILEAVSVMGRESVQILDSLGRVLAEDVVVLEDIPSADISAVDGYAVRRESVGGVPQRKPQLLKVVGESPAGRPCNAVVGGGEAVRVMTGALIPRGADTVVLLEDTEEQGDNVLCVRDPGPAANIRFRGESLSRGAVVLPAGKVIGPVEIGTLASVRRAYVHVHQKPLVAILSTGDELVDFHEPLTAGKTMCSNLYSLAAQVLECGARPLSLGIAPDICDVQQCILSQGMHADVIITSGGLSKGKYDLVRNSLVSMGMEMKFQNVLLKPGKPVIFGTIGDRLVFGVPGNPSAAMISFDEFIRPALLKMMGYRNWSGSPDGMPCSTSSFPSCKLMDTLEDTWNDEDGNRRASLVPSRKSAPANGESLNTRHVYGAQRSFI